MTDAAPSYKNMILVRFAPEIMLKSKATRMRFLDILMRNMRVGFEGAGIKAEVKPEMGRIMVMTEAVPAAMEVLSRTFGVANFSPIEAVVDKPDLEDIKRLAVETFGHRLAGKRFAVRFKQLGRKLWRTRDAERDVGAALYPFAAGVDLDHPDMTVRVDLHNQRVMLYAERHDGPDGFPASIQGRVVTLMSGGFDSAVAAWFMMKRGAASDFVFCNLAGEAYELMTLRVAKRLTDRWAMGTRPRITVVDFGPVIDELRRTVVRDFWQIVLKRLMYRAGNAVAGRIKADAIVTGEALGQVSSQTLSNLNSIETASDIPVLRPLIGFEKTEIIRIARKIGTAELSEHVPEYCGIAKKGPAVSSSRKRAEAEEAKMDPQVLETALRSARVLDLSRITDEQLGAAHLLTDDVPPGAVLLDLQPKDLFDAWHAPDAVNRDPEDLERTFTELDRAPIYILYCPQGVLSAHLAEVMQKAGYRALAIRGGLGPLLRKY